MNLSRYEVLSFDCYGTLVDWETGIRDALAPMLAAHGVPWSPERLLAEYGRAESALEAGPYRRYREVHERLVDEIGARAGFTPSAEERTRTWRSMADWKPFPDTVAALRSLQQHCKLVIISNVDDDLFAQTNATLGVTFHAIVTAEQVGAYKPSTRNFEAALARVGEPREVWLHVAQSLYHDVPPAKRMGLATAWVNRQAGKAGVTPASDAVPDLEVPDLATLAHLLGMAKLTGVR